MSLDAWIAIGVVLTIFPLMALSRLGSDVILLGAVMLLLVLGVLSPEEALGGFSHSGLFTVACMYVLVAGIRETGGIDLLVRHVLGRPRSERRALFRLLVPVASLSGLLNNTPIVAAYLPAVLSWSRRLGFSAQRFLLPLSFASILGGTITLFGTSTNLVVYGLLRERYPALNMGLFDLAWVGIPVALAGLVYLLTVAPVLLPRREGASRAFANPREFTIEMEVDARGPLAERTVEEAGLRHLRELFLVEIERAGNIVSVVGPGEVLKGGDRLVFAGTRSAAVELQQIRGLLPSRDTHSNLETTFKERRLVEVVVSRQCQFIGQRIRDGRFRTLYGAVVLAICRGGERVTGNLGHVRLQPADVLLLEVRPPFLARHRQSREFLLVSELNGAARPAHEKAPLAWGILFSVASLAALGVTSLLNAAVMGAAAVLLTGCCSVGSAKRSLDVQVLLTIAASFGVGAALTGSGAANTLAGAVISLSSGSPWLLLVCVYIVVALLTEVVTNNAAAVIMFPVAMSAAESLGVSPMPFVVALMFAASTSFLTPLGYQTNLMVYGPGGYQLRDFLRVGGGLNLLTAAIALSLIPLIWPF